MDSFWIELAKSLGIAAPVVVGTVWLIQLITKQLLSKDLAIFKSNLEKESLEFRIKFEKLHSERADVVKELHKKIVDAYDKFSDYANPLQQVGGGIPTKEEKAHLAANSLNELNKYFRQNSIFLDESLEKDVKGLMDQFNSTWRSYQSALDLRSSGIPNVDTWGKTWNELQEIVPVTTELIKKQFRKIIGIN